MFTAERKRILVEKVEGVRQAVAALGVVDAPAPPPTKLSPWRCDQPLLFQRAHALIEPCVYTNSLGQEIRVPLQDYYFNAYEPGRNSSGATGCGSSAYYLCGLTKWPWDREGGDWRDRNGVRHGSEPWATVTIPAGAPAGSLDIDATELVKWCDANAGHWYVPMLQVAGGTLQLAGPCNLTAPHSTLHITRAGAEETLALWYAATTRPGHQLDAQDNIIKPQPSWHGLLEFFPPETTVGGDGEKVFVPRSPTRQEASAATLRLQHLGNPGAALTVKVMLVSPPLPDFAAPRVEGIAKDFHLDIGLFDHEAIAAAMRVDDDSVIEDILAVEHTFSLGVGAGNPGYHGQPGHDARFEESYDPTLYGTPGEGHLSGVPMPTPQEMAAKIPHVTTTTTGTRMVGKVYNNGERATVTIRTAAEVKAMGITPLAPNVGAVEFLYPAGEPLNGQSSYSSVTSGGPASGLGDTDLEMPLKRRYMGRASKASLRMMVCLAKGWEQNDKHFQYIWHPPGGVGAGLFPEQAGFSPNAVQFRPFDTTGKFPGGLQQTTIGFQVPVPKYPNRINPTTGQPDFSTALTWVGGGYSSSSGYYGYQNRFTYARGHYKEGHPGPATGGAMIGLEQYDFAQHANCIPSQAYIGGWDTQGVNASSHNGMGFLYQGQWYCIEFDLDLNSVRLPPGEEPGIDYREQGHIVDAQVRWYINDIKSAETPKFAFRSSIAFIDWLQQTESGQPFGGRRLRPITNVPPEDFMGVAMAVMQCYPGGRATLPVDMSVLINMLAVSVGGVHIGRPLGVPLECGGLGIVTPTP